MGGSTDAVVVRKLLIFAGVPPPIHGQNLMVAALVAGLKTRSDLNVFHVDPRLSSRTDEIGQSSWGKLFRLLWACARVWQIRLREGPMPFYYVPAPAQRVPIIRDWVVMLLCRPFFPELMLHWHAVGLGNWIDGAAPFFFRRLTHWALDRAALAIVLATALQKDAAHFRPRRVLAIANGITDPSLPEWPERDSSGPFEVLFLGLGNEAKGLFRAAAGTILINQRQPGRFRLTFAGNFATPEDEERFARLMQGHPSELRRVGLVSGSVKANLLHASDVLCLPTSYANEGQPLVLIEALACDLPIITTAWRAIPEMLPKSDYIQFITTVEDGGGAIASALEAAHGRGRPRGELRAYFLEHFTLERHLEAMASALFEFGADPARRPTGR